MKILIDASICSKGGGVQVALAFINNISRDSEFEIICVTSPQLDNQLSDETKSKIAHYYPEVDEPIWRKYRQAKRLSEIELKHNPDLVFVVFGPSYWRPKAPTLQGFALPLMVYPETRNRVYRNQKTSYFYQKLLNAYKATLMKKNSDYIVVETCTFKDRLHDFLGFDNEKIFVVENSFNANFLEIEAKDSSSEYINIFIPTAYYPHKNLEILVDVAVELAALKQENVRFNFLLDQKSLHWQAIILAANKKNVSNNFHTYGPVSNKQMVELYAETDFVLLPTVAEASTAVYPESFISQRVLLTSNVDFAVELCGDAAIYFDPYDAKDIANKIFAIQQDKEMQNSLISNGLKQLKVSYSTPEQKWLKQKDLILSLI